MVLTNPNTPLLQVVEYGMVEKPVDARQLEAATGELLAELRSRG